MVFVGGNKTNTIDSVCLDFVKNIKLNNNQIKRNKQLKNETNRSRKSQKKLTKYCRN